MGSLEWVPRMQTVMERSATTARSRGIGRASVPNQASGVASEAVAAGEEAEATAGVEVATVVATDWSSWKRMVDRQATFINPQVVRMKQTVQLKKKGKR